MANSYVNKVNMADGTTIIDISDTSIDVNKIPNGSVVYLATGERIVGEAIVYNVYNGLDKTTSGYALVARQGKELKDQIDGLTTGVSGVKGNAENTYRIGQVNLTAENVGALSLSGGTMTGAIVRKSVNNWDTPPSETTYYNLISAYDDSNNYIRAHLQIVRGTAGNYGIYLAARSSGNGDKPFLGVSVDGSGNAGYMVSHPEVFRTTIGAASFSDIVAASGTYNFGSLAANSYSSATITIPTQPNLNYIVLVNTLTGNVTWGVQSKTTTSFAIYVRNVTSAAATASVTWAVIRM